jgi:hypothetical protein
MMSLYYNYIFQDDVLDSKYLKAWKKLFKSSNISKGFSDPKIEIEWYSREREGMIVSLTASNKEWGDGWYFARLDLLADASNCGLIHAHDVELDYGEGYDDDDEAELPEEYKSLYKEMLAIGVDMARDMKYSQIRYTANENQLHTIEALLAVGFVEKPELDFINKRTMNMIHTYILNL